MTRSADAIVIRLADAADAAPLRRLAQRDSSEPPHGVTLVAEVGGRIQAGVQLDGGRAIADPFEPTAGLLALLRMRADQLRSGQRREASPRQALVRGRRRHHSPHRPAAARVA